MFHFVPKARVPNRPCTESKSKLTFTCIHTCTCNDAAHKTCSIILLVLEKKLKTCLR